MYASTYFTLASVLLGSALAYPAESYHNATLANRGVVCPEGAYCGDCYEGGTCGSLAMTIGVSPAFIGVGNLELSKIADMLASTHCYMQDSVHDLKVCATDPVVFPVDLADGDQGQVSVEIAVDSYPKWAENLFHDTILATLQGTVVINTQTTSFAPPKTINVHKIPSSFSIARLDTPGDTMTFSISVQDIAPASTSICDTLLTTAAAIIGVIPEVGAPAAAVLTIGSLFCAS